MKFKSFIVFIAVCFGLAMVSFVAVSALKKSNKAIEITSTAYLPFLELVQTSDFQLKEILLQVQSFEPGRGLAGVAESIAALENNIATFQGDIFTPVLVDLNKQGVEIPAVATVAQLKDELEIMFTTGSASQLSQFGETIRILQLQIQQLNSQTLALVKLQQSQAVMQNEATIMAILRTSAGAALIVIMSQLFLYRSVVLRVNRLTTQFTAIAAGASNLNVKMDIGGNDELTRLGQAFNGFIERIRQSLSEATVTLEELQDMSNMAEFFEVHGIVTEKLNEQAVQISMVAAASEQMTQTVSAVATSAETAATMVQHVKQSAFDGKNTANNARTTISNLVAQVGTAAGMIDTLSESSSSIRSVVNLIRTIAEQTNLLALNAAIEAARAGETGRGFAVVADEVRALASRTAQSTNDIEAQVTQIAQIAENTVAVMDATVRAGQSADESSEGASQAFQSIVVHVTEMADHNVAIASATTEQKFTIDDIVSNIQLINIVAQEVIPEALKKIAEQAHKIEQVRHTVDIVDQTLQDLRG